MFRSTRVRSQEPGARSQESGVRSQEPGSQESGVRSQEPGVRSAGARSQEPGALSRPDARELESKFDQISGILAATCAGTRLLQRSQ